MSYQFAQSVAPLRKVQRVEFGILSPEAIVKQSVVKVEHEVLYENKEPKVGSLSDVRMGCIDKNMECYTCKETINNCAGHFGHIELHVAMYHIQFIKVVKKILECVCHRCARFRLLPTDHRYKKLLHVKEKFKYACEQTKNKNACEYPDCEEKLLPLRRSGIQLFYDRKKIDKKMPKMMLSAADAREILCRISDDTCRLIGLDPVRARPEWMIITVLPVPPPCVRPSISVDTNGRSEDDLTHMLTNIIKYNNLVKRNENSRAVEELKELLQSHVTAYIDNDTSGVDKITQRSVRPIKSLSARLKGKDGLIRGHLMGKRVDFSARTVITGDPNISIEEVGVPYSIAKKLTFPETVNRFNIERLQRLVDNSPEYPGAKFVVRENGSRLDLQFAARKPTLKIGETVERHMQTGDIVIFNRQPTLHKPSMMGHRVRVMQNSTFRLNVNICSSYNADFDGDEMNLHMPQSHATRAELMELSRVSQLLVTAQSGKPVNALVQDALCGIRQLTLRDTFLTRDRMMNLLMFMDGCVTESSPEESAFGEDSIFGAPSKSAFGRRRIVLPVPAILKPTPLWTGKQLLSMMLPRIDLAGFHSVHNNRLETWKKKYNPTADRVREWVEQNPEDTRVLIQDGELITGIICKRTAGASCGSIVHIIWKDYGPDVAKAFMDNASSIIVQWMLMTGFSVGLGDAVVAKDTFAGLQSVIDEQYKRAGAVINMYKDGSLPPQGNMSVEETKENKMQEILARARDAAGTLVEETLRKGNNIKQMVEAGSKGSVLNICQISASVGQQIVDGKRVPYGYDRRTLPHYEKLEDSPESRGFVRNSFINGLKPQEVFFHAMGGREGLIDTACRSVTGDTPIVILEQGVPKYVKIGDWIDSHLEKRKEDVRHYEQRQMEMLDLDDDVYIPTMDADGNVTWGEIAAVTRHDPGDVLYKVKTLGGREVIVTESKSLLIWDPARKQFHEKPTSQVKIGDYVPVTARLAEPPVIVDRVDMTDYFPKTEYIHGTDFNLAVRSMKEAMAARAKIPPGWWAANNGTTFTLPYTKKALLQRALVRSLSVKDGYIYPYHASREQAKMAEFFPLNRDNGVFIGLFLAEGNACVNNGGSVNISNNDPTIQHFVAGWFERNGIKCEIHHRIIEGRGESSGVRGFSTMLAKFLETFVGHGARNKYVPDVAFVAPEEFVVGLLDGYFSGDGSVAKTNILVGSVSKRLILGIGHLLSRLHIFCKYATKQQVYNNLGTKDILPMHHIVIHSFWSKIFADKITLTLPSKQEKLKHFKGLIQSRHFTSHVDTILDPITAIYKKDVKMYPKVYDLTVPSTLNFTIANLLTCADTAETGYIQRRLIKALEDICVKYDGTVRNSKNDVIQFYYGEDGFDGTAIENQVFDTMLLSDAEFASKYHVDELHDTEWKQLAEDRLFLRENLRNGENKWPLPLNLKRILTRAQALHPRGTPIPSHDYVYTKVSALRKSLRPSRLDISLKREEDADLHPSALFGILLTGTLASKRIVQHRKMTKEAFDWAVRNIEKRYYQGLVQPGESVGIVAAQSIGEPATQMTLNVFHLSGTGNKAVTTGIPRLKELINAVKSLKTPGMTVYLDENLRTDPIAARRIKCALEHCTLAHLVETIDIHHDPDYTQSIAVQDRRWLDIVNDIPDDDMPPPNTLHPWLLRMVLSRKSLVEKDISIEDVVDKLLATFDDEIVVFHSDDNAEELVLHVRMYKDHDDVDQAEEESTSTAFAFLESIKTDLINNLTVKGVPGIDKAFISQKPIVEYGGDGALSTNRKEFIIETDGINLKDVVKISGVDAQRIYCNDPREMMNVFGIEVARATLIEEIRNVIESGGSYINYRHLCLLCEVMTSRGQIMSITRHGINKTEAGPLTKCTFEQTVDILVDAAVYGESDNVRGVAENLMLGQLAPIGTGMMDIYEKDNPRCKMPDDETWDEYDYEMQEVHAYNDAVLGNTESESNEWADEYSPLRPSYLRR